MVPRGLPESGWRAIIPRKCLVARPLGRRTRAGDEAVRISASARDAGDPDTCGRIGGALDGEMIALRNTRSEDPGAGGGTRTHTLLRAADFESAASTDSATPARGRSIADGPGRPGSEAEAAVAGHRRGEDEDQGDQ